MYLNKIHYLIGKRPIAYCKNYNFVGISAFRKT
jgi:hypothetical protein